jgi:asparagine synthase (glutamine-hydrolysing)
VIDDDVGRPPAAIDDGEGPGDVMDAPPSRIAGAVIFDGRRPSPETCAALSDACRADHCDGMVWEGRRIALASASTAPDSPGARAASVHDAEHQLTLVADVRLDDRRSLLSALGCTTKDPDDAELLLRAYVRWGVDCVDHLLGAFAFAVWDERSQRLFCARDHFGLKSMHYWSGGGRFLFATYAESVCDLSGVARVADPEAVAARRARHAGVARERSFFAGVLKLPPGELLVVDGGGSVRRTPYWRAEARPRLELPSRADYADALRDAVSTAVQDAVRDVGPFGVHLSGGLDSGALAVLAEQHLRRRDRHLEGLYSWSPTPVGELADDDERIRVLRLAAQLGRTPDFTDLDEDDVRRHRQRAASLVSNDTLLYESAVMRAASERGLRVLLSGWGGDELASFNGRGHLAHLARTGRWLTLGREVDKRVRLAGYRGREVPAAALRELRRGLMPLLSPAARERRGWLNTAFDRNFVSDDERVNLLRAQVRQAVCDRGSARATQLALLGNGHVTLRIEAWARAGAIWGIEHRYPLLDRRVIDLCLAFPDELWRQDGWGRWVFRAAMDPLVPAEVTWGPSKHEPAAVSAARSRTERVVPP